MSEETAIDGIRAKIGRLLEGLDTSFLERREHSRLALLSVLSGHHMLMLGPPGTAKSLLARAVCQCVAEGRYFEYLLSRFTHPDELFGPVSIPGLKEEDYRRLTEGYLPDAHVAFLDEIFKANSAILNSLLTLINERIFHHGTHRDRVPLLAAIGASNEPPDVDGGLGALYDRFLVRIAVLPLASQESFLQVCLGDVVAFEPSEDDALTLDDLAAVRRAASKVTAGESTRRILVQIREALQREEVEASDRRWRWAVELIKVSAATSGRTTIEPVDLLLLQYCFGTPCESDAQVQRAVCQEVLGGMRAEVNLQDLRILEGGFRQPPPLDQGYEAARSTRMAQVDELEALCARLEAELDQRRRDLLTNFQSSPWISEVPAEAFTALIAARSALHEDLQPFRESATAYRAQLESADLCDSFFGAFVLQSRMRSVFFYDDDCVPVAWIGAEGADPDHWVGLMPEGGMLSEAARLDRARAILKQRGADVWHERVLCLRVDNDMLFELCRRDDWAQRARSHVARSHEASGLDGIELDIVAPAFSTLIETFRGAIQDPFPRPETRQPNGPR